MTSAIQRLGKYDILEELGRGGFGAVYRALDTTLKREVALKILNPALLYEEGWLARFRREAQVIAALDHPRIVAVYEIAEADNRVFIAMKLLRGPSLDKVLAERGALPWAEAQRITREVAEALAYAHAQGVLHRDLKPANIVLDTVTGAALTDFGFARIVGDTSLSLSLSGGLVGTPHYLAPELWHNQPASPASDLYALGCILYEMVLGRKAFPGDTSPAVMMAHFQPLALPETWPEKTPPGLDAVLRRTLAQQPGDRYPTIAAFAETLAALDVDLLAAPYAALEAAVAAGQWLEVLRLAEALHAQAPTYRDVIKLREKAKAEITRVDLIAQWPAQTEASLQAGQLPAAHTAVEQWLRLAPGNKEAQADAPAAHSDGFSRSTPPATLTRTETVASNPPTPEKSVKLPAWLWGVIVIVCSTIVAGIGYPLSSSTLTTTTAPTPQLVAQAGTIVPKPLTPISPENVVQVTQLACWGKGTVSQAIYSPDGRILAVASSLGIYLYDALTLEELRWIKTETAVTSMAYAPDGNMFVFVSSLDKTVQLWRLSDGTLLHALKGHTSFVDSVAFAPDGNTLASGARDDTVRLWRVNDGKLLHTLKGHPVQCLA